MANGRKKSKKKIFIISGIAVVLVALILIALFGGSKDEVIAVQTEKVQKRNITQTVSATGKINSEFQVIITPEVTGEIVSLPVKEGQKVTKGNLLIKIKGDIYVAQRERAEANLKSAQSSLAMRKAELDRITLDYKRVQELHNKKLASDAELETSKSNYLSTQAGYEGAEANVLQMRASLKEITEQIYKTTINAPMDGTVSGLNVELGERILGSGFSQGTNLMTVADLNNMEATVEVDENDVVLVSIGDTAKIKIDAFGDKEFIGVVTEIGNAAKEEGLGTQEQVVNFNVKIKLLHPDSGLRPGMSCTAEIQTETKNDVVSVPIMSVTARGNEAPQGGNPGEEGEGGNQPVVQKKNGNDKPKEIVFVLQNGKAKKREVKTGLSDDNFIEIIDGLKVNDVVITGSYKAISRELQDGSVVKVDGGDKNKKKS
ncbi:MAG: efflux RND transporter periplasmic adaptor subunit [Syntrophothermus sp.]